MPPPTTLQITQWLLPVHRMADADGFEHHAYETTVWTFDGTAARVHPVPVPPHYVRGLLLCYCDHRKVPLSEFVAALDALQLGALQTIETAIRETP